MNLQSCMRNEYFVGWIFCCIFNVSTWCTHIFVRTWTKNLSHHLEWCTILLLNKNWGLSIGNHWNLCNFLLSVSCTLKYSDKLLRFNFCTKNCQEQWGDLWFKNLWKNWKLNKIMTYPTMSFMYIIKLINNCCDKTSKKCYQRARNSEYCKFWYAQGIENIKTVSNP